MNKPNAENREVEGKKTKICLSVNFKDHILVTVKVRGKVFVLPLCSIVYIQPTNELSLSKVSLEHKM